MSKKSAEKIAVVTGGSTGMGLAAAKRVVQEGMDQYNASHEVTETMPRATAELKASGIEERALKVE